MLLAFELEMERYADFLSGEIPDTLYFGGGTPSLLTGDEIGGLMDRVKTVFGLSPDAEITLEANPDDLTSDYLNMLKDTGINRLSIGVQSFNDEDLKWMNRAHNANQAETCLQSALKAGFDRISVDLIYGIPGSNAQRWKDNLDRFFNTGITHLSAYSLTVEKGTPLQRSIEKGKKTGTSDELALAQYMFLQEEISRNGWEQYEISNYCTQGHYSRHNSSYWEQKHYLGIGPSAHSFNGISRSWNPRINALYIRSMMEGGDCRETETLTPKDIFNERLLTGLRTKKGFDIAQTEQMTGFRPDLEVLSGLIAKGQVTEREGILYLSEVGRWFADSVTAELFLD